MLEVDTDKKVEPSAPFGLTQLQVQLADAYAPREALAQMEPLKGLLSRAWSEYITFISKNMGYRGSVMSYAQFCGYHTTATMLLVLVLAIAARSTFFHCSVPVDHSVSTCRSVDCSSLLVRRTTVLSSRWL